MSYSLLFGDDSTAKMLLSNMRADLIRTHMRAVLGTVWGSHSSRSDVSVPKPSSGQVLVRVAACAVCRTDLHVVDGELPNRILPLIQVTKSSGASNRLAKTSRISKPVDASAFPGLAGPAGNAIIASPIARISASERSLPATRSTVDMRNTLWPTHSFVSTFRKRLR